MCGNVFFYKQKTAYEMCMSDWSSDVCYSDLPAPAQTFTQLSGIIAQAGPAIATAAPAVSSTAPALKAAIAVGIAASVAIPAGSSHESRVGTEGVTTVSYWWAP